MSFQRFTALQVEQLKREARFIKKAEGVTHSEALNRIARREGFAHWAHLMRESEQAN